MCGDEMQEGDQVLVKVINLDPSGKVRLSRKALLPAPDGRYRRGARASDGGSELERRSTARTDPRSRGPRNLGGNRDQIQG